MIRWTAWAFNPGDVFVFWQHQWIVNIQRQLFPWNHTCLRLTNDENSISLEAPTSSQMASPRSLFHFLNCTEEESSAVTLHMTLALNSKVSVPHCPSVAKRSCAIFYIKVDNCETRHINPRFLNMAQTDQPHPGPGLLTITLLRFLFLIALGWNACLQRTL